jgi:hypothetical protein
VYVSASLSPGVHGTCTSKVAEYKYKHAETCGLAKKYNDLDVVLGMLEKGIVDPCAKTALAVGAAAAIAPLACCHGCLLVLRSPKHVLLS